MIASKTSVLLLLMSNYFRLEIVVMEKQNLTWKNNNKLMKIQTHHEVKKVTC